MVSLAAKLRTRTDHSNTRIANSTSSEEEIPQAQGPLECVPSDLFSSPEPIRLQFDRLICPDSDTLEATDRTWTQVLMSDADADEDEVFRLLNTTSDFHPSSPVLAPSGEKPTWTMIEGPFGEDGRLQQRVLSAPAPHSFYLPEPLRSTPSPLLSRRSPFSRTNYHITTIDSGAATFGFGGSESLALTTNPNPCSEFVFDEAHDHKLSTPHQLDGFPSPCVSDSASSAVLSHSMDYLRLLLAEVSSRIDPLQVWDNLPLVSTSPSRSHPLQEKVMIVQEEIGEHVADASVERHSSPMADRKQTSPELSQCTPIAPIVFDRRDREDESSGSEAEQIVQDKSWPASRSINRNLHKRSFTIICEHAELAPENDGQLRKLYKDAIQTLKPKPFGPRKVGRLTYLETEIQKHSMAMCLASHCKDYIDNGPIDIELVDRVRHLRRTLLRKGTYIRRVIRKNCGLLLADLRKLKLVGSSFEVPKFPTAGELDALTDEQRNAILLMSEEERDVIWQKCVEEADSKIEWVEETQKKFPVVLPC